MKTIAYYCSRVIAIFVIICLSLTIGLLPLGWSKTAQLIQTGLHLSQTQIHIFDAIVICCLMPVQIIIDCLIGHKLWAWSNQLKQKAQLSTPTKKFSLSDYIFD